MPLRSIAFLLYFFGSSAAAVAVPMFGIVCYIVLYHIHPSTTWCGERITFLGACPSKFKNAVEGYVAVAKP